MRDLLTCTAPHLIRAGEVIIKIYSDQRHAIEETVYERSYNSLNPVKVEQTYSLSALTQRLMSAQVRQSRHCGPLTHKYRAVKSMTAFSHRRVRSPSNRKLVA